MTSVTVNISDIKASADPDAVLVTHALGSCIGVCATPYTAIELVNTKPFTSALMASFSTFIDPATLFT